MEWALLAGLSPDDQHRFLECCRRRRFGKNEIVFHEGDRGDSLNLIRKGRFAIRASTPRGDVATLALSGPGQFFGEGALLSAQAVVVAPRLAARAVRFAPALADDPVAPAVCTARSPVCLAIRIASIAASVASEALDRTPVAVVLATFEPVGDTRGFLPPT